MANRPRTTPTTRSRETMELSSEVGYYVGRDDTFTNSFLNGLFVDPTDVQILSKSLARINFAVISQRNEGLAAIETFWRSVYTIGVKFRNRRLDAGWRAFDIFTGQLGDVLSTLSGVLSFRMSNEGKAKVPDPEAEQALEDSTQSFSKHRLLLQQMVYDDRYKVNRAGVESRYDVSWFSGAPPPPPPVELGEYQSNSPAILDSAMQEYVYDPEILRGILPVMFTVDFSVASARQDALDVLHEAMRGESFSVEFAGQRFPNDYALILDTSPRFLSLVEGLRKTLAVSGGSKVQEKKAGNLKSIFDAAKGFFSTRLELAKLLYDPNALFDRARYELKYRLKWSPSEEEIDVTTDLTPQQLDAQNALLDAAARKFLSSSQGADDVRAVYAAADAYSKAVNLKFHADEVELSVGKVLSTQMGATLVPIRGTLRGFLSIVASAARIFISVAPALITAIKFTRKLAESAEEAFGTRTVEEEVDVGEIATELSDEELADSVGLAYEQINDFRALPSADMNDVRNLVVQLLAFANKVNPDILTEENTANLDKIREPSLLFPEGVVSFDVPERRAFLGAVQTSIAALGGMDKSAESLFKFVVSVSNKADSLDVAAVETVATLRREVGDMMKRLREQLAAGTSGSAFADRLKENATKLDELLQQRAGFQERVNEGFKNVRETAAQESEVRKQQHEVVVEAIDGVKTDIGELKGGVAAVSEGVNRLEDRVGDLEAGVAPEAVGEI